LNIMIDGSFFLVSSESVPGITPEASALAENSAFDDDQLAGTAEQPVSRIDNHRLGEAALDVIVGGRAVGGAVVHELAGVSTVF
jgi:hypothetical protein